MHKLVATQDATYFTVECFEWEASWTEILSVRKVVF